MSGHGSNSSQMSFPVDGWRAASRCGPDGGNCVEVNLAARDADGTVDIVGIRDSKPVSGPVLVLGADGWRRFRTAAITDHFHS